MSISATYIKLQQTVADELGDRQDLLVPLTDSGLTLSPIQNAIQSAISKWEREPFYFNEIYDENIFSTVLLQEFYTSFDSAIIGSSPGMLKLHVYISSNRYPLNVRTWQYLEDIATNPVVTGQPVDYAYYAEKLRFYPIPNGAYPITISATERKSALAVDADTNCWTQDAYDLIRSEAKLILAQETLNDDELATRCRMAIYGNPVVRGERGYLYALKAESTRRAKSHIRSTYF